VGRRILASASGFAMPAIAFLIPLAGRAVLAS
jgi:hypothetical protein